MKSTSNYSYKKSSKPETENQNQRTIDEVLEEIRDIVENTHWVQTRLSQFEASGFEVEECWVKNSSIETMWFMKRKKVLRIQVCESEQHGDFQKAKCVIIPASDIQFQEGDVSRVRKLPDFN